jgi:hypothetical protein
MLLLLPAMILLVAAYVPSRIRTAVRHPMLVAVALWAFGHLLANGDLASAVLFGTFLAYAVYDIVSATQRAALGPLGGAQGSGNWRCRSGRGWTRALRFSRVLGSPVAHRRTAVVVGMRSWIAAVNSR